MFFKLGVFLGGGRTKSQLTVFVLISYISFKNTYFSYYFFKYLTFRWGKSIFEKKKNIKVGAPGWLRQCSVVRGSQGFKLEFHVGSRDKNLEKNYKAS